MEKLKIKNQINFLQKFEKIIFTIFFLFCFFGVFNFANALTINSQTGNAGGDTLKSGLVGRWTFDGADLVSNVADKSGNGNHGYMVNMATSTAKVGGVLGQALKFDGVNDYVSVPATSASSITISFWFKLNNNFSSSNTGIMTFFDVYSNISINSNISLVGNEAPAGAYTNGSLVFKSEASVLSYLSTNKVSWNANRWYNVVAVLNSGSSMSVYIDGVLDKTVSTTNSWSSFSALTSYFGGGTTNWQGNVDFTRYLLGLMDDVRIYNRALSVSEIQKLYNQGGSKLTSQTLNAGGDTLKSGLVGWWTFDGADLVSNVADKSGNGNHGYMVNMATSTAKVGGVLGQALKFDGVNDRININNTLLGLASTTISVWVNPKTYVGNGVIYIDGNTRLSMVVTYNTVRFSCDNTTTQIRPANDSVPLNKWTHVVVVRGGLNSNTVTFFINGVQSGSSNQSCGTIGAESSPNYIGDNGFGSAVFLGSMDDVRIYNRALSASEIQKLYNQGGSKLTSQTPNAGGDTLKSGLVGHWTFDGADLVSNLADKSGTGNTGYMFNFTSTTSAKVAGKLGQALKFDGVNDYVRTMNLGSASFTSGISASVWVYPKKLSGYMTVFDSAARQLSLWIGSSYYGIGQAQGTYTPSSSFVTNQWQHIVLTSNGSTGTLYRNGAVIASGLIVSTNFSQAVELGSNPSGGGSYFDGSIDDFRIYNRALSASEVKQLYNLGR